MVTSVSDSINSNLQSAFMVDGSGNIALRMSGAGSAPLSYKGAIDCSTNPNYPAAGIGDVYIVSVAGKIGGASGPNVVAGDMLIAKVATAAGDHAAVGSNWDIIETNVDFTNIAYAGITELELGPALNYGGGQSYVVDDHQTTNDTPTTILQVAVADNTALSLEANIIGMKNDGSDRAEYLFRGTFYRDGGNVAQQGSTVSLLEIESNSSWDADFSVNTSEQTIDIVVTGVAATTINWKAFVKSAVVSA